MRKASLMTIATVSISVLTTTSLVLSNKFVLNSVKCGAVSAGVLTTIHNIVSYVYVVVVHGLQHATEATSRRASASSYLLISCLSAISLISSNVLLRDGSVLFHQLARVVCMPVGALVDMIVEGRSISTLEVYLMILICLAALVAASDQQAAVLTHSFTALFFISSYVATASYVRYTARRFDLSSTEILHGILPYSIAVSCSWLAFMVFVRDDNTACSFPSNLWFSLPANCFLAISVQVLSTWTMKELSVRLYAVVGQIKTAVTVLVGSLILGEHISNRARCSFVLIILLGGISTVAEHSDASRRKQMCKIVIVASIFAFGGVSIISSKDMNLRKMNSLVYGFFNSSHSGNMSGGKTLANFTRFADYDWNGAHESRLSSIVTISEFRAMYKDSSVREESDCTFPSTSSDPFSCWYHHENICVDGSDNIKFLRDSNDSYMERATELKLTIASGPLRPIELKWESFTEDTKIQVLRGRVILLHCWRSTGHNPIHFTFGYGALFASMIASRSSESAIDHVVLHQCPNPHLNELFRAFWEVMLMEGYEKRLIDDSTSFHVVSDLSRLVCMEKVTGNEWARPPWFGASESEWNVWRGHLMRYLQIKFPGLLERAVSRYHNTNSQKRIAIFQRKEAANGLRKYVNLLDVLQLVGRYTDEYEVITTTSETNLTRIIELFNSFDILITPHGSHIANVLFTLRDDVVIIETVGVCMNTFPMHWFDRRLHYVISSGHRSNENSVQQIIDECLNERDAWCLNGDPPSDSCHDGKAEEVMRSDLIVDVRRLEKDLEQAHQFLSQMQERLHK